VRSRERDPNFAAGTRVAAPPPMRGGLRDLVEATQHFMSALALWWTVGKG
jgi:hypothetical protein